jgi:ectoine hydroxylase-related dioxygenase (phytanoyl-CoA dioxygenase family)
MREKFTKKGYLLVKDFLNNSEKKIITNLFFDTLEKYNNKKYKVRDFNNSKLHSDLFEFRNTNPKEFGNFFDELPLNANLRSVIHAKKFLNLSSEILGVGKNLIFINGYKIRLDAPLDKRNNLDWHQDSSYFLQTYPNFNAFVCWLPLTDNSAKNGTLQFIPESHSTYIKTKLARKNKLSSLQSMINIRQNDKIKNFNAKSGDAGIFHMNLKHKSGTNISKKFRITIAFRCHDLSQGFHIGKELYHYNDANFFKKKGIESEQAPLPGEIKLIPGSLS